MVVAIHIPVFSSFDSVYAPYLDFGVKQYIARLAVPFYFTSAGYFLFRKIDLVKFDVSITKNYVFRILRLLGLWKILLFVGGTYHLWYLGGLVVAVVMLSILLQWKIPLKRLSVLAVALYIVGLLGDSYYNLLLPLREIQSIRYAMKAFRMFFSTTRNGFFMGFPFVFIGLLFAKKDIKMKTSLAVGGFLLSILLMGIEIFTIVSKDLPKDYNMNIFLVPSTFFLFYLALNINLKERAIYKKLRVAGMMVYYSHLIVYQFIRWGFAFIRFCWGIELTHSFVVYLLTIGIATALGFLAEWLSHKEKFAHVKWLYT